MGVWRWWSTCRGSRTPGRDQRGEWVSDFVGFVIGLTKLLYCLLPLDMYCVLSLGCFAFFFKSTQVLMQRLPIEMCVIATSWASDASSSSLQSNGLCLSISVSTSLYISFIYGTETKARGAKGSKGESLNRLAKPETDIVVKRRK